MSESWSIQLGKEDGKPVEITFVRGKYVILKYEGHLSVHEWDIFFWVLERLYGKIDECKYEEE